MLAGRGSLKACAWTWHDAELLIYARRHAEGTSAKVLWIYFDEDFNGLMGNEIQVAFVVSRLERLAEMEHGEILALERGARGRVFANVGPAEHWLRHGV